MKKTALFIVMVMMVLFVMPITAGYADSVVTMYAPDGRQINVYSSEVESYKAVGWYETYEEVVSTLYAPDGRTVTVYDAEVEAYLQVGWYKTYEEVISTLYAPDGRTVTVYNAEVDAYLKVGWYKTYEEVTTKLYAPDGREIVVYNSEVEAYLSVGWFTDKSDFVTKMRSSDGKIIEVYDVEVASYIKKGWCPIQKEKIDPSKPMVALTFDDGPNPSYTPRILNVLEAYNARATFFVVGNLVPRNRSIVKRTVSIGCQVGNHSYSHPNLANMSYGGVSSQIQSTSNEIYNASGKYPKLLRPPYGSYNKTVSSAAGMPLILWSIDTLDWKHRDANRVYSHILSNVRDGDIVLMHDIYASTATAAERVIPELLKRGYQLVTVDELFKYKGKSLSAGYSYTSAR